MNTRLRRSHCPASMPACRSARGAGFTLVELLVALVIFSTMAVIAYSGLSAVTTTHERLSEREATLADIGRALSLIERDLRSLAPRRVWAANAPLPPLSAQGPMLEVSTFGRGRVLGPDLGLVERIGYLSDGDALYRQRWPAPDRLPATRPDQQRLLAEVEQLRWRFLDLQGRWQDRWPVPGAADADAWPRAVEFVLVHARLGELRRLVELPEAPQP